MVLTAICRNTPRRKQRWNQSRGETSSKQGITGITGASGLKTDITLMLNL